MVFLYMVRRSIDTQAGRTAACVDVDFKPGPYVVPGLTFVVAPQPAGSVAFVRVDD